MKQHFIIKNNQKHLLLFFAGWGMDETPFLQIRPTNKDWLICYDYRSLEFDAIIFARVFRNYPHCLVHGSMGSFSDNETISIPAPLPKYRYQWHPLSYT